MGYEGSALQKLCSLENDMLFDFSLNGDIICLKNKHSERFLNRSSVDQSRTLKRKTLKSPLKPSKIEE